MMSFILAMISIALAMFCFINENHRLGVFFVLCAVLNLVFGVLILINL